MITDAMEELTLHPIVAEMPTMSASRYLIAQIGGAIVRVLALQM